MLPISYIHIIEIFLNKLNVLVISDETTLLLES